MRLKDGFVANGEMTFGELKFSALRRSVMVEDEDGRVTGEVKAFTYDLRSRAQGKMIQVTIPAESGVKEYKPGEFVSLVNPKLGTVSSPTFNGAEVDWFIKADDIVLKRPGASPAPSPVPKKDEKKG